MRHIPYIGPQCGLGFKTFAALSLSASVLAFGAAPAFAADAASDAESVASNTSDGAEITVTARRRVENLHTTPVSATVLTVDNLAQQNVRNFQDLRGAVSNLELQPLASGGASFTVRGIGQVSNQVNVDAKAGFYVNDMYVGRQEGNDLYFYDVASLQVLKGPQGTLFGKNTTAGAVLLTTQTPTAEFGGYAKLRLGSYRRIDAEGAINIPLTEGISSRFSFRTQNANGYIKHVLDNDTSGNINDKSARFQIRSEGTPLTIDLLGEYNQSKTDGGSRIVLGCDAAQSYYQPNYNALHAVPYCSAYPVLGKDYLVYGGATLTVPTSAAITDYANGGDANGAGLTRHGHPGPFNDTRVYTLNGRLNYELADGLNLHSVTAYRRSGAAFYTPTNNAPNDIYAEYDKTRTKQFTQELTLGYQGMDDRLNVLAGLYYYNQNTTFLQDTGPDWIDPLGYVYDASVKYESYAAFLQGSFKITPKLELTVGGRYTHDKKSGDSYVFFAGKAGTFPAVTIPGQPAPISSCGYFLGDFLGGIANCGGDPFTAADSRSWHGFDPKVQLSYRWTDNVFTYLTAARGYNAGGFNQQLGRQPADGKFFSSYNPEKVWSYEGGVKLDLMDHAVILDVSAFYQKFTDIQSTVLVLIGGISTIQVQSAADAHEEGLEAEFTIRPVRDLTIRGNASYLKQGYDKINPGALAFFDKDTPINSAPKYTFSAAIDYTIHTGESGTLVPSVDVRGIGSKPACQSGAAFICRLPAYALVGFRLDYTPSDDSAWKVGVYGTNVFDKVIQLNRTGYAPLWGIDSYAPGRPQEFGFEASVRF
ncbi:MAG TPA: TonB-dependent receptor [Sphingobium sp.]